MTPPAIAVPSPPSLVALAVAVVLLVLGIPLVMGLRSLDADRAAGHRTAATLLGATATRVTYSVIVVLAFTLLLIAWALGLVPTGGLAPLLTAPLAVRLGDVVSHRSGAALSPALRDALLLIALFAALYLIGVTLLPT